MSSFAFSDEQRAAVLKDFLLARAPDDTYEAIEPGCPFDEFVSAYVALVLEWRQAQVIARRAALDEDETRAAEGLRKVRDVLLRAIEASVAVLTLPAHASDELRSKAAGDVVGAANMGATTQLATAYVSVLRELRGLKKDQLSAAAALHNLTAISPSRS